MRGWSVRRCGEACPRLQSNLMRRFTRTLPAQCLSVYFDRVAHWRMSSLTSSIERLCSVSDDRKPSSTASISSSVSGNSSASRKSRISWRSSEVSFGSSSRISLMLMRHPTYRFVCRSPSTKENWAIAKDRRPGRWVVAGGNASAGRRLGETCRRIGVSAHRPKR